jgi:ribosome-associated protein
MSKTSSTGETNVKPLANQLVVAAQAAYDKKATDVVVLDMRKIPSFTDYFLLCTARNQRQLRAVADAIDMALRETGARAAHIEGNEGSEWILLDYFDMVVHVFTADKRLFYGLERLWGSAEHVPVPEPEQQG